MIRLKYHHQSTGLRIGANGNLQLNWSPLTNRNNPGSDPQALSDANAGAWVCVEVYTDVSGAVNPSRPLLY